MKVGVQKVSFCTHKNKKNKNILYNSLGASWGLSLTLKGVSEQQMSSLANRDDCGLQQVWDAFLQKFKQTL